ncbi:DNA (cytosine-5-)-methyltransferase [Pseudomonas sp. GD03842]|uniref:DNA (cytosine-5-)-methyltransferase n=1 Tax=Pseudomonas sp. GD03842 TaxID=2975385 RepID=UPI00244718BA|nr:DNA (cytosine-5-)-methyltransferase [Pseudomonas sp. GD03842]MDH0745245.1 DNA (cytosine-5-)-methyltransferase [Pseudomonas sp. GD03842]
MQIDYGSVCSGIEAATAAWRPLGMTPAWFAEIEPFPSAVLAHRYPNVQNLGDMTKLAIQVLTGKINAPAVLVGGTPCQAFSVAGMREGLADPRGALTIKYVELADAIDHVRARRGEREVVTVWENVPGVLSDKGNAFGCFLGALVGESEELQPPGGKWKDAGCVYGPTRAAAWRILDAQYFGLAQRRRRVFVVASARDGFDPAAVLFEREGVRRDTAPRRGEGPDIASTLTGGARKHGGYSTDDLPCVAAPLTTNQYGDHESRESLLVFGGGANCQATDVSTALSAHPGGTRMDAETETFVVHGTQDPDVMQELAHALGRNQGQENAVLAFSCKDHGADAGALSPTLRAMNHSASHANAGGQVAVCITGEVTHTLKADGFDGSEDGTGRGQPIVTHAIQAGALRTNPASGPDGAGVQADHAYTLEARAEVQAFQSGSAVRRLTPIECERLQGFPDEYTLIPWRGKPAAECPDGPRYKAIGNSKAVPVVRWIGRRLLQQLSHQ